MSFGCLYHHLCRLFGHVRNCKSLHKVGTWKIATCISVAWEGRSLWWSGVFILATRTLLQPVVRLPSRWDTQSKNIFDLERLSAIGRDIASRCEMQRRSWRLSGSFSVFVHGEHYSRWLILRRMVSSMSAFSDSSGILKTLDVASMSLKGLKLPCRYLRRCDLEMVYQLFVAKMFNVLMRQYVTICLMLLLF